MAVTKAHLQQQEVVLDDEDILLDDLRKKYSFWKAKKNPEYAQAYLVLLNRFTQLPAEANEE